MIRNFLLGFLLILASLFITSQAFAFDPTAQVCKDAPTSPACQGGSGDTNPIAGSNGVINTVIDIIALVGGVAAVIVIIVSGISYITANGNAEAITKARQRITGAIVGLVIISLSWVIISYVNVHILK